MTGYVLREARLSGAYLREIFAVHFIGPEITTAPLALQSPDQPWNAVPGSMFAANCTVAPSGNAAVQTSESQLIPGGMDTMRYLPVPCTRRVSRVCERIVSKVVRDPS